MSVNNKLQVNLEENLALEKWDNNDLAKVRIRLLRGHLDSVNSCQFIEDADIVFSASSDCSVKLWNFRTGESIKSFNELHNNTITQAHCKPDGSRFLSCGLDKKLKYVDVETGKCILDKNHTDFLTCCRISHNGKLISVGSDLNNSLTIYDVESGDTVCELKDYHKSTITSIKFSPSDDKVITTSRDYTAKFFDLVTSTNTISLEGHINVVADCDITNDERNCATASWDKTIGVWDVSTGMYRSKGPTVLKGSHDGSVSCCQFSNDGLLLVTGSNDNSIVVWDLVNNTQKLKLQGHTDWINAVNFSQDQKWLLSCSKDKTIRLWNLEESDKIPMVLESKKAVRVVKCTTCSKPFSLSQLEAFQDVTVCVFCRLNSPEKSWLIFNEADE
ncbi:WD repeat-containing protein 88 [Biomphalaria pfeifferi]|uniref:WD repeat-containing protein 88 n=1 Tax=Biomphalaria pfeifferi TaxID=112525 RepID=A0AAD8BCD9_BIOPF|nr:WD repeat-containing protein 88 [Biomphalaria pfeifferi]